MNKNPDDQVLFLSALMVYQDSLLMCTLSAVFDASVAVLHEDHLQESQACVYFCMTMLSLTFILLSFKSKLKTCLFSSAYRSVVFTNVSPVLDVFVVCVCLCVHMYACVCVCDEMSVSIYLCKCSRLLQDGAP